MASQRINSGSQHTQLSTECQGRHGPRHNVNDLFPYSHEPVHYPEIGAQKEVEVDMEVEREHLGSGTIRGIAGVGGAGDLDYMGEFLETSNSRAAQRTIQRSRLMQLGHLAIPAVRPLRVSYIVEM